MRSKGIGSTPIEGLKKFSLNTLSRVIKEVVGSGNQPPSQQTRYVYSFNGVDSYIQLNPISYSVDDLITFKVLFNSVQPIYARLVGGSIGNDEKIQMDGTGTKVWMSSAAYEVISIDGGDPNKVITDGVVHTITVRIKQPVTYSVINSNNPSSNSNYFTGFLFDYTDSLGNSLPINDRTFGVNAPIANSATVLGVEQAANVTAEGDYSLSGNTYTLNRPDSQTGGQLRLPLINGAYLVELEVVTGANVAIRDSTSVVINPARAGRSSYIVPIANGELRVNNAAIGASCQVILHSVRKADGYATGVNLLESGWMEIPL